MSESSINTQDRQHDSWNLPLLKMSKIHQTEYILISESPAIGGEAVRRVHWFKVKKKVGLKPLRNFNGLGVKKEYFLSVAHMLKRELFVALFFKFSENDTSKRKSSSI